MPEPLVVSVRNSDFQRLVLASWFKAETSSPPPWVRVNYSLVFEDSIFDCLSPVAQLVYIKLLVLSVRHRNRIRIDRLVRRQLHVPNLLRYLGELVQVGLLTETKASSVGGDPATMPGSPADSTTGSEQFRGGSARINMDAGFSNSGSSRDIVYVTDVREETEATNVRTYEGRELPASLSPGAPAPRAPKNPLRRRSPEEIESRRRSQLRFVKIALQVADDAANALDAQERVGLFGEVVEGSGDQERGSESPPCPDAEALDCSDGIQSGSAEGTREGEGLLNLSGARDDEPPGSRATAEGPDVLPDLKGSLGSNRSPER
jgi:hypothetical protein